MNSPARKKLDRKEPIMKAPVQGAFSCLLTTPAATRFTRGLRLGKILLDIHLFRLPKEGETDDGIGNRLDNLDRQRVVSGKPLFFQ
jgi:hypothetical protein